MINKTILLEYDYFDIVYMKVDVEQKPRQIVGVKLRPGDLVIYVITDGIGEAEAYAGELSKEKDQTLI